MRYDDGFERSEAIKVIVVCTVIAVLLTLICGGLLSVIGWLVTACMLVNTVADEFKLKNEIIRELKAEIEHLRRRIDG